MGRAWFPQPAKTLHAWLVGVDRNGGRGDFSRGDAPTTVAATPSVVEDWGRLYDKPVLRSPEQMPAESSDSSTNTKQSVVDALWQNLYTRLHSRECLRL